MVVGRLIVVGLIVAASPARAFHIPEHLEITRRAVAELQLCGLLPSEWNGDWTQSVVAADQQEDLDLLRKWSRYSHYYNPNHSLVGYRVDSSVSVRESVAAIEANRSDVYRVNQLIGRIIHHVQDASVPGHAVPVAHGEGDGFEKFDVSSYYAEPLSPASCVSIAAEEPMRVLHGNALATLRALSERLSFSRGQVRIEGTWLGAFWTLGQGNHFGRYGSLGNAFGKAGLSPPDGETLHVDSSEYTRFKRARIEAAVRATQAVILWANRVRGF